MPDAYTYIAKPTGTPYTNTNVQGKEQYDQPDLTFDSALVFYDGVNMSAYTNVAKPSGGTTTIIQPGMATGLITPFTYATAHVITVNNPYTSIPKPTT